MAVTENDYPKFDAGFTPMNHAPRVERLRSLISGAGLDGLVVTNLTNIRYLCGFTGSAAILLVTTDDLFFVTDGRYTNQSAEEIPAGGSGAIIEIAAADADGVVANRARAAGVGRVGVEEETITWDSYLRWDQKLLPDAEIVRSGSLVEEIRLRKDPDEVARIRAACEIADTALASVRGRLLEGPTEREFALELDVAMKRMGAADVSFETIVASGPNGAKPHHHPSDRRISEGDLVVIDFGALVDGYHSDMTRTLAVGDVGQVRKRMLEVVLESQQAGVEAVAAGVGAAKVDAVCRDIIVDAGWGDAFVHGTGHGVGLYIHEEPRVSSRSTAILEPGHVVTVEPGVYLPDLGGVRIEDTVLVTETGCDRLTRAPKNPFVP